MTDNILKTVSTEDLIAELYNRPGVVRSVFTIADMENQLEEDSDTADLPADVKEKIAVAFINKIRGDMEDALGSRGNAFIDDKWSDEKEALIEHYVTKAPSL